MTNLQINTSYIRNIAVTLSYINMTVTCLGTVPCMKRLLIANKKSSTPRLMPKWNIKLWEHVKTDDVVYFVSVADNTFLLQLETQNCTDIKVTQIKKKIFGYRLLPYRCVTENGFVIMVTVFGEFYPKINSSLDKATKESFRCYSLQHALD